MTLWEKQLTVARDIIERNGGLVKTSVLLDAGITYKTILTLTEKGKIIRARSGYYSIPDAVVTEEQYIVNQFPDGVLTMESGLYYRGYLSERPAEWRIAISKNISKSRLHIETPKLIPYFSEESALTLGVEEMIIAGKKMQVYGVDRLICDVLKFQDRMTKEDVRSCIRSYIDDDNKDIDKLVYIAEKRRVRHKIDNVLGAWINLPTPEKKPRKAVNSKKNENTETNNAVEEVRSIKENQEKEESKNIYNSTRQELVFNTLPESEEFRPLQSTIVIDPKAKSKKEFKVRSSVESEDEPIQNIDVTEENEFDLSDISIAELCFDVYRQMEMIEDMSIFHKIYTVLTEENINGRKVKKEIQEISEDKNFDLTQDRLKKIVGWSSDKFMEQKWRRYCKRQDNLSLTWKIVALKVSLFIIPIGQAIIKKEPFTGDWMPDIGRFLD